MLKSKKGACVGPQIKEPMQDVKSEDQLREVGKATWKSLTLNLLAPTTVGARINP